MDGGTRRHHRDTFQTTWADILKQKADFLFFPSHQGYELSRAGCLVGGRLLCGLHGSTFDPATGQSCRPPATGSVPIYRAELEDGEIWVCLGETLPG